MSAKGRKADVWEQAAEVAEVPEAAFCPTERAVGQPHCRREIVKPNFP
jgi:hypothetical protein